MERQGTSSDSLSSRDLALLEKANAEALKASWLMTAPNPRVGALALKKGHIVGRGFHEFLGSMHAEESALRDAAGCLPPRALRWGMAARFIETVKGLCR